jgi:hypothetical protein
MRTDLKQQLAVQATLNALIGRREFDRLCSGMRVRIDRGILYVFVANEDCAAEIEATFSDELAVAAEQILGKPVLAVNVLPLDFSSSQE